MDNEENPVSGMEIIDPEVKNKILSKVARHLDIEYYYDLHTLSFEEYWAKYDFRDYGFKNFYEIRFYPETNVFVQLSKLLSPEEEYFLLPIDQNRKIYRGNLDLLDQLFPDPAKAYVLVVDTKLNWVVIKDEFNKLIGIGNQIRKKISKKVYMTFAGERIMYNLTPAKPQEKENTDESHTH